MRKKTTGPSFYALTNTCGILMVVMLGLLFLETSAINPHPLPYIMGVFGFGGLFVLFASHIDKE
jgi:hypothetical protein